MAVTEQDKVDIEFIRHRSPKETEHLILALSVRDPAAVEVVMHHHNPPLDIGILFDGVLDEGVMIHAATAVAVHNEEEHVALDEIIIRGYVGRLIVALALIGYEFEGLVVNALAVMVARSRGYRHSPAQRS